MRAPCRAALLPLVLFLLSCSEGPELVAQPEATQVMDLVQEKFTAIKPTLDRALKLERADEGFKPILPEDLHKQAPGRWRTPGPHKLDVTLPETSSGATRITSGPVTIEVTPVGIRDVPAAVSDNSIVYPDAYPHADTFHVAEVDRVEKFILLRDERAPKKFQYEIKVLRGGGRVRQLGGVVEVLDDRGDAWIRLAKPWAVDQAGERRQLQPILRGRRLTLDLPSSLRRFPVMVDPGWLTTGSMAASYSFARLVRLASGKVLIWGSGKNAELYSHTTGTWTVTGAPAYDHNGGASALLADGRVLVIGGNTTASSSKSEVYDPATGKWSQTADLKVPMSGTTLTLLGDGTVLAAGGSINTQLFDPKAGTWKLVGMMSITRTNPSATLLANGMVLVAGGENSNQTEQQTAELYDPAKGTWTPTGTMLHRRAYHTATRLSTGEVLVVGGGSVKDSLNRSELYDPAKGTWKSVGNMAAERGSHRAVLLPSGQVMVAGGSDGSCWAKG